MPSLLAPPVKSHVWAPSQITVLQRHPGVAPPSAVEQIAGVVVVAPGIVVVVVVAPDIVVVVVVVVVAPGIVVVTCVAVVAVLPVVSVIDVQ